MMIRFQSLIPYSCSLEETTQNLVLILVYNCKAFYSLEKKNEATTYKTHPDQRRIVVIDIW